MTTTQSPTWKRRCLPAQLYSGQLVSMLTIHASLSCRHSDRRPHHPLQHGHSASPTLRLPDLCYGHGHERDGEESADGRSAGQYSLGDPERAVSPGGLTGQSTSQSTYRRLRRSRLATYVGLHYSPGCGVSYRLAEILEVCSLQYLGGLDRVLEPAWAGWLPWVPSECSSLSCRGLWYLSKIPVLSDGRLRGCSWETWPRRTDAPNRGSSINQMGLQRPCQRNCTFSAL